MRKPDELLEHDVRETLEWDPRVNEMRVAIAADDGHVTLSGSVPTYYEKIRASEDAWSVAGVRTVDNELYVGAIGGEINDEQLAKECRAALDHDRFVPKDAVQVTVSHAKVRLTGHVRNHFQRQAAEHAVSGVDGILSIENLVVISPEPMPGDVAARIHKAFRRNAILDDAVLTVTNDGHTVTLHGTVGSYAAMREAIETAYAAPGVTDVVNDLVIVR